MREAWIEKTDGKFELRHYLDSSSSKKFGVVSGAYH
jgi:hypothetical protein